MLRADEFGSVGYATPRPSAEITPSGSLLLSLKPMSTAH